MKKKFQELYDFISNDLWRTDNRKVSRTRRIGYSTLKTLVLSVRGFNDNDVNMRANSLTYSFMFALVPMLALILAFARGFGFEAVIQEYLDKSFLGQYDPKIIGAIMGFVQRYLETAQGGVFLGIGILILLWAIYSFFRNVEISFNKIWQVSKNRNAARQFANYLTILIAVPILMIASSGISIFVNTRIGETSLFLHMGAIKEFSIKCIPWAMSWIIFIFMYKAIPHTHVNWKAAIIPGIIIGTLVQVLQMLSVYVIMFLSRTSVVYGAFAVVPLLLTWVQWLCMLILFGAELSYSIQNNERFDYLMDTESMSRRYKDYLTLYILYTIVKRFEKAEPALTAQEIAQNNNLPVRIVNQLISRMVEAGLLSELRPDYDKTTDTRYQPAMDINQLTVGLVFAHINEQGGELFFRNLPKEMDWFWRKWIKINEKTEADDNLLVKDLLYE